MIDEVMRIVDSLPISSHRIGNQSLILKKELEDQNQRIEILKTKMKTLTNDGGPQDQLYMVEKQLNNEFSKLDKMLKTKMDYHSKSMQPTNIIHLATTTEEDNLPPIMLYTPNNKDKSREQVCRLDNSREPFSRLPSKQPPSLQRVPSHDHPVPSNQRKAEEKFHKIQKKLIDLCDGDAQNNLNDDTKKQFDNLYSELRILEKELFHDDCPDFDSFQNSEKKIAFQTLRQQNAMLLEQGEHFQVLFKEQQLEIENYRKKYMRTLQNVMEQHMRITSMENESKSSEKKTCEEITRMKNNLRKKLDHLAPMSNMLENCNKKLIHTIKRKTEMEQNYQDICDELRELKKELANSVGSNYKAKCEFLGAELKKTKEVNEFNNKRLNQMQQQLSQARSELERVKLKSSKTIKSTMKKCDFLRNELKSRINQLEIELAQSKAIAVANSK